MMRVFLAALPFALGGAVSPTLLAIEMVVLAAPTRGRLKGFAYFLGTLVFSLLFVLALHFLFHRIGLAQPDRAKDQLDGIIDLVLGSLLVLWATVRVVRGPKPPKAKGEARARREMGVFGAFGVGFLMMMFNFSTLPLYAIAVRQVDRSSLAMGQKALLFTVVTVIVLIPSWLPVTLAVLIPKQSARVLAALRTFLAEHSHAIITAILVIFGFFLIFKGGPKLWH